jgi:hypothetical protein
MRKDWNIAPWAMRLSTRTEPGTADNNLPSNDLVLGDGAEINHVSTLLNTTEFRNQVPPRMPGQY